MKCILFCKIESCLYCLKELCMKQTVGNFVSFAGDSEPSDLGVAVPEEKVLHGLREEFIPALRLPNEPDYQSVKKINIFYRDVF